MTEDPKFEPVENRKFYLKETYIGIAFMAAMVGFMLFTQGATDHLVSGCKGGIKYIAANPFQAFTGLVLLVVGFVAYFKLNKK